MTNTDAGLRASFFARFCIICSADAVLLFRHAEELALVACEGDAPVRGRFDVEENAVVGGHGMPEWVGCIGTLWTSRPGCWKRDAPALSNVGVLTGG